MKRNFLTLLWISSLAPCLAQDVDLSLPKVIPPSPVAMELAKYVTYPVDLCNGLVKISIPLYEIVDGDIKIPITLNYHASGLKPNLLSSDWLGDGWSLNVGPNLSRTIHGGADEIFYFPDIIANPYPTYDQLRTVAEQTNDITLDEFYYSLPNNHGRLYFKRFPGQPLRPVTIPRDCVKVSLPVPGRYDNFIDITDAEGFRYSFGGMEEELQGLCVQQIRTQCD